MFRVQSTRKSEMPDHNLTCHCQSAGILSFFAVQAGAKKVYAIEASSMAVHCARLVSANRLADKITVIAGKVEEVGVVSGCGLTSKLCIC